MRQNLRELVSRNVAFLLDNDPNSRQHVADRMGVSDGSLGRIRYNTTNPTLDVIERIARYFKLEPWELLRPIGKEAARAPDYIRFEHLDVEASAGPGREPVDTPVVLQHIDIHTQWAKQLLGCTDPDRIKIITVSGDSMADTINDGDIAFVDISHNYYYGDGIYVINLGGQIHIKRLSATLDNRIAVKSDNKTSYETEYITQDRAADLNVIGRVVRWWTLRRS